MNQKEIENLIKSREQRIWKMKERMKKQGFSNEFIVKFIGE